MFQTRYRVFKRGAYWLVLDKHKDKYLEQKHLTRAEARKWVDQLNKGETDMIVKKAPPPPCPACGVGMREIPIHNCTSRYVPGVFICNGCGQREAFEGFFWDEVAFEKSPRAWQDTQARWVDSNKGV